MERTVPKTGGEEIQLYMRTYYSLLRSTDSVRIETLVESHIAMESSLHVEARNMEPDVSTLIYSALRLPACIIDVNEVLIGQIERSFVNAGFTDIAEWERVFAPGRRRRMHFDGNEFLAVYIVSRSDIDDLIPILTAYQIEWNKLNIILNNDTVREFLEAHRDEAEPLSDGAVEKLAELTLMHPTEIRRLELVWKGNFIKTLEHIASHRKQMGMRLISGSLADYRRATATWWEELCGQMFSNGIHPEDHPIYFVSSNIHSLINLLTGFARRYEENIIEYIKSRNEETLLAEYRDIKQSYTKSQENFLYYVLRNYLSDNGNAARERLAQESRSIGIHRVPNKHGFEIEAQIIDLSKLHTEWLDPRVREDSDLSLLAESNALIINIDYPLGMAAYEIMSRIAERVEGLRGVYIMGKAATLNGRIGDVMIPNVIHDEHSQNTYLFRNCFTARDLSPYMSYGNVLDNQKAVTALGTYLQNPGYMSVFYREGYTDIEMEGGPYLSAVYEAFRPKRHPQNEIVNLYGVPFDVGILHYASDTPMKKGQNLGAGNLNYIGVEPTYATAIAILRRILQHEIKLLTEKTQKEPQHTS